MIDECRSRHSALSFFKKCGSLCEDTRHLKPTLPGMVNNLNLKSNFTAFLINLWSLLSFIGKSSWMDTILKIPLRQGKFKKCFTTLP